jgi:hypothetical protein
MNPYTGHLTNDESLITSEHVPVPVHLRRAAIDKLAGGSEAHVSLTSGSALSRFAAEQREKAAGNRKAKSRRRNKQAKASRARNR